MTTTTGLYEQVNVVLDSSGNGAAFLGPTRAGEKWMIRNTQISCSGSVPSNGQVSTWFAYLAQGALPIDSSYSPQQDQSDTMISLGPGQHVYYVWINGPVGGRASVTVTGDRIMPR